MIKTRTMFVKGNNWFEQFSTIANFFYQFVGKKVKITVEVIEDGKKYRMGKIMESCQGAMPA